ncbi:protein MIS12 homolog [Triticum dicoccoides]|uniref:protein MIS12 homolog n=1 Tax=Triticum dicoccoides TaxID=85692 RepID=UPI000E7CB4C2|nr:protein MIS12 homolog [Triticum dicoccoides]XP_037460895.1 protein MIS12 homolog [Triticum dicoccoides]XP_037460896.1 protein MIS12 homolog [Triticum dicoccoides]XP_037460897.1 protein MIS12 homolog [Triticum dicoccoides]
MEGDDETSAVEAVLGLSPQIFINEVLNMVDDIRFQAFEYCLQEGAPAAVSTATATNQAEELKRGVNAICNLVTDVLNKRMSNWEMYCLRKCLTVPEGFVAPEDDNSSATVLHKDGNSDSELDAELNFLRKKLADANTESEELRRESTSLERQATYKSNLNSSITEVLKLYEDKSVKENIQGIVKAIPKLHQKMKVMRRKKVEVEAMVGQNVWNVDCLRDQKRLAPGSSPSTEDIQEVNTAMKGLRKE